MSAEPIQVSFADGRNQFTWGNIWHFLRYTLTVSLNWKQNQCLNPVKMTWDGLLWVPSCMLIAVPNNCPFHLSYWNFTLERTERTSLKIITKNKNSCFISQHVKVIEYFIDRYHQLEDICVKMFYRFSFPIYYLSLYWMDTKYYHICSASIEILTLMLFLFRYQYDKW